MTSIRSSATLGKCLALSAVAFLSQSVLGQTTHTLTSTGANNWSSATWTNGAPATNPGDIAEYGTAATASTTTLDVTGVTVGQLVVSNTGNWTINSGAGTSIGLDNTGGTTNPFLGTTAFIGKTGTGAFVINPAITFANTALTVGTTTTGALTLGGGITGTGNVFIANSSTGTITIQTAAINNIGNIILGKSDASTPQSGTGAITISGGIGSNVASFTNNAAGTATISGGITGATSVTQNATGNLILSASNSYSGGTTITSGTLQVTGSGTLGSGAVNVASGGTLAFNYAAGSVLTFANGVSGAGNVSLTGTGAASPVISLLNPTFGGNVTLSSGTGNARLILAGSDNQTLGNLTASAGNSFFIKTGAGSLTLPGTDSTSGYGTWINGGELILDYTSGNNNKLSNNNGVQLGGATVTLKNGSGYTQVIGSTTIQQGGGASTIQQSSSTNTLQMGAFTRNPGGTLNISGAGVATTTTANSNGILGPWATLGSGSSMRYATGSGVTPFAIVGYTAGTSITDINQSISASANYDIGSLSVTTLSAARLANTIRYAGAGDTVDLGSSGAFNLKTNGLMNVGGTLTFQRSGTSTGTLSGNATELVVTGSGNIVVNVPIANGSGASALTMSNTGTLTLGASNTYTGVTYLNSGTTSISANDNLGAPATGAAVNLNGGALKATANVALDDGAGHLRAVNLGGNGGTFNVDPAVTLTIGGVVANTVLNASPLVVAYGSLTKTGSGALILSGTNTYSGPTTITGGTLTAGSTGALGGTAKVTVNSGGSLGSSVANVNLGGALEIAGGTFAANGGSTGSFTLAANQNFTMTSGTISLSFASISLYDQIVGSGTGTFTLSGGTLDLTNSITDYTASYQLFSGFSAGSIGGISFTNYDHIWIPSVSSSGVLSFTAIPEPSHYALALSGLMLVIVGARRIRRKMA